MEGINEPLSKVMELASFTTLRLLPFRDSIGLPGSGTPAGQVMAPRAVSPGKRVPAPSRMPDRTVSD